VYARSRDDLEKLVDKGLEAADKATAYSSGGGVSAILTVIAAVTQVATAAAAPGLPVLGIVAASASAGATILGLTADQEAKEEQLDTSGTQALFFSIQRVVGTQSSDMSTRLERVQDALDSLNNQLSSYNEVRDEIVGPAVTGDHMYGPNLGISPEWGDDFRPHQTAPDVY
jgi:hypothetical protein